MRSVGLALAYVEVLCHVLPARSSPSQPWTGEFHAHKPVAAWQCVGGGRIGSRGSKVANGLFRKLGALIGVPFLWVFL